ncbi:MAG: addiction module protein [Burkholderiales bacterium]|nr:addiction module protein [Burkholderiales bacterium]MBK8666311.1 addiction module protein [Burkholderiales bacterium]
MPTQLESLAAQSLLLNSADRASLAQVLLASLDEDETIGAAWAREIDRRVQAIESGEMAVLSLTDVLARARNAAA